MKNLNFIVGAQKSGTTSLARLLRDNRDVCHCEPKEPHYFSRNFEEGEQWYHDCFADLSAKVLIDSSTSYTQAPPKDSPNIRPMDRYRIGVPERISHVNPDAKFVYIVRNPIDRLYSAYWHQVRAGYEKRSFAEMLKKDSAYFWTSDYVLQVKALLEYYPLASIKLVIFEDFKCNPLAVLNEVEQFLGLETTEMLNDAQSEKNRGLRWNLLGRVVSGLGLMKLGRVSPSFIKKLARRMLSSEIPPMFPSHRELLREQFADQPKGLETLFGIRVDHWKDFK